MKNGEFKTKIVTLVKDEREYIDEWISYHLRLGFDCIDVYEDYDASSHEDIARKYSSAVHVKKLADKVPPYEGYWKNARRYGFLLEKLLVEDKGEFDWILCADVDEYLMFEPGYSLNMLLREFSRYPGIYLYWKYMSASGHIEKRRNIVESYTKPSDYNYSGAYEFKCLYNLEKSLLCLRHNHHCARYGVDTAGNIVFPDKAKPRPKYEKAWINHYFTKSWEDWLDRIYKKGNLTPNLRMLHDFFSFN